MNRTDIEAALRSAGLPVLPEVTGGADWSVDYAYRIRKGPHGTALFLTGDDYAGEGLCALVWRREDREEGCYRFQLVCEGSLGECLGRACFALSPAEFESWEMQ